MLVFVLTEGALVQRIVTAVPFLLAALVTAQVLSKSESSGIEDVGRALSLLAPK